MNFDAVRARIRSKHNETGIPADVYYRRYLLERFIARIAASKHHSSIIIKGGMLISAIAGIDSRATHDLDTTISGKNLTIADFENIIRDVLQNLVDNTCENKYTDLKWQLLRTSSRHCGLDPQ